ncbi:MAG: hypothetical protein ACXWUN_09925 [Allosphingosinicella sp.]
MVAKNGENAGGNSDRNRAADAYQAARDRTYSAYETARDRAADVTRQATDQIAIYPVGAVIGGLAIGALLGFLVPASRREKDMLGVAGRKVTGAAREVAQRGLDAGKEQMEELRSQATRKVGEAVVEAVSGGKG